MVLGAVLLSVFQVGGGKPPRIMAVSHQSADTSVGGGGKLGPRAGETAAVQGPNKSPLVFHSISPFCG